MQLGVVGLGRMRANPMRHLDRGGVYETALRYPFGSHVERTP